MEQVQKESLQCQCGAEAETYVRESYNNDVLERTIISVDQPFCRLTDGSVVCDTCGRTLQHA